MSNLETRSLSLKACAKINLRLCVGPKLKNGYHTLNTIFQEISLHDQLILKGTKGPIRILGKPGISPRGKRNIIIRALVLLKEKLKVQKGMDVRLDKKIPIGAGLGGGSSDAAAALWGGWILWKKKKISCYRKTVPKILVQCAKRLGADVPFFLKGRKAQAQGIGERLKPLKGGPRKWIVVVCPKVLVSTAKAYRWLDRSRIMKGKKTCLKRNACNSFEDVVVPRFGLIKKAFKALRSAECRTVRLSGSGSAVFGFVSGPRAGKKVLKKIKGRRWDLFLVHTL